MTAYKFCEKCGVPVVTYHDDGNITRVSKDCYHDWQMTLNFLAAFSFLASLLYVFADKLGFGLFTAVLAVVLGLFGEYLRRSSHVVRKRN